MKFDTILYAVAFALLAIFAAPAGDAQQDETVAVRKTAPTIALQPAELDTDEHTDAAEDEHKYTPI